MATSVELDELRLIDIDLPTDTTGGERSNEEQFGIRERTVHLIYHEKDSEIGDHVDAVVAKLPHRKCTNFKRDAHDGGLEVKSRALLIDAAMWIIIICSDSNLLEEPLLKLEEDLALLHIYCNKNIGLIYLIGESVNELVSKGCLHVRLSSPSYMEEVIKLVESEPSVMQSEFKRLLYALRNLSRDYWDPVRVSVDMWIRERLEDEFKGSWVIQVQTWKYDIQDDGTITRINSSTGEHSEVVSDMQQIYEDFDEDIDEDFDSVKFNYGPNPVNEKTINRISLIVTVIFYALSVCIVIGGSVLLGLHSAQIPKDESIHAQSVFVGVCIVVTFASMILHFSVSKEILAISCSQLILMLFSLAIHIWYSLPNTNMPNVMYIPVYNGILINISWQGAVIFQTFIFRLRTKKYKLTIGATIFTVLNFWGTWCYYCLRFQWFYVEAGLVDRDRLTITFTLYISQIINFMAIQKHTRFLITHFRQYAICQEIRKFDRFSDLIMLLLFTAMWILPCIVVNYLSGKYLSFHQTKHRIFNRRGIIYHTTASQRLCCTCSLCQPNSIWVHHDVFKTQTASFISNSRFKQMF